jgi:hydrogenase-1 operon protein HyaF
MSTERANDFLQAINVRVEGVSELAESELFTLNVLPLLHEVRHSLERLLASGEETTIDLGSIPLAPGELDKIDDALGTGEVKAMLESLGPSQIYETRFSGVWRITHFNAANEVVGRFIEVTRMPAILFAQDVDVRASLVQLTEKLSGTSD